MRYTWLIATLAIIGIPLVITYIARRAVHKDNKDMREEVEEEISKDAERTIREAKQWIEEDNKISGGNRMVKIKNNNSLGELLALEPTAEDYEEYIRKVTNKIKNLFENYQFFMYEPNSSDLVSGYLLQFQILGHEEIYDELFVHAMDSGLDMDVVDDYFFEALEAGDIIPIGDSIILERDGTGISPIKSGDDVRVIISFITEEYKQRQEEAEADKDE